VRVPLPAVVLAAFILGMALPFPSPAEAALGVVTRSGSPATAQLTAALEGSSVAADGMPLGVRSAQQSTKGQGDALGYQEQGPSLGGLLLRAAGALALMTLLALAAALLAKRYMPGLKGFSAHGTSRVQLLESRRLTSRLTLFVVEFDGRRLLLAQSGDRIVEVGASVRDSQSAGA